MEKKTVILGHLRLGRVRVVFIQLHKERKERLLNNKTIQALLLKIINCF